MASEPYTHLEQDFSIPKDGDELPTYDDLAVQGGPNSRFGRWRGWIEKRAAERYIDITPEERNRRRERGWGNDQMEDYEEASPDGYSNTSPGGYSNASPGGYSNVPAIVNDPPTPNPMNLQMLTDGINSYYPPSDIPRQPSPPLPPLPPVSQKLGDTHLKLHQFGSRFLPHTKSAIHCLLPILSDRLLLIGHDDGLSVLDMYPQDCSESGERTLKGPDEAQARLVWEGDSVFQMDLLEVEDIGEGSPQGVVLLLVGPQHGATSLKESESLRTLRMYNLASLTSLAKWTIAQKGSRPVQLHRPSNWHAQQTPTKKHRPQSSIARGIKHFIESPHNSSHGQQSPEAQTSGMLSPPPRSPGKSKSVSAIRDLKRGESDEWDMIEDLPLRWATDFVPLASAGSRLINSSVLSYAVWTGTGLGRLLAIATKTNILLYETPRGERAFRFVKEFYTPLQPRSITFFQQTVPDVVRSLSDVGGPGSRFQTHNRTESTSGLRDKRMSTSSTSTTTLNYGPQLSLFVIFDKKAGWIRLADSAVGEMEMYDDGATRSIHHRESSSGSGTLKSSRSDLHAGMGKWIPPVKCELPIPSSSHNSVKKVHLMTRGKQTHIVPCPLPVGTIPAPPIRVINWKNAPTHVTPRICRESAGLTPFLQLINLGAHGVEVQEISLSFLSKGKGKGKAVVDESLWAEEDTGGDTGFLCSGGHWDNPKNLPYRGLSRSMSTASDMSFSSITSLSTTEMKTKLRKEEGIYAWCRRGVEDWRILWLGNSTQETNPMEDDY